jgi:hypothetical protein
MPPRAWAAQPAVRRVVRGDDCTAAIAAAVAGGARLLFVDGDAALTRPAVLGSAEDPIALLASGTLTIVGDVAVHGVIHAASLDWRDGATGSRSCTARPSSVVTLAATPRPTSSATPRSSIGSHASGSFVCVNGSWKDF